jgi:hypothetical protein
MEPTSYRPTQFPDGVVSPGIPKTSSRRVRELRKAPDWSPRLIIIRTRANSHQIEKLAVSIFHIESPTKLHISISRRVAAAAVQHHCYWAQSPVGLVYRLAHIINSLMYIIKSIYVYVSIYLYIRLSEAEPNLLDMQSGAYHSLYGGDGGHIYSYVKRSTSLNFDCHPLFA